MTRTAIRDEEKTPLLYCSKQSDYTVTDSGGRYNMIRDKTVSRKSRPTMLALFVIGFALVFLTWKWYLRPEQGEEWEFKEGFMASGGSYEIAKSHHFDGVRVQDLDPSLVPGGEADPDGKRRLVFVGDIHGCAYELKKLLDEVDFDEETDHLITVGDNISKGPDNVEVLDMLFKMGASSVRGNHEDRILSVAPAVLEAGDLPEDVDTEKLSKDTELLKQLSRYHLDFLRNMPLMIRVPPLPKADSTSHKVDSPIGEEILVVHAGLVPAVTLEKQDPYFVMNMRSIHTKTHHPMAEAESKKDKTKAWHDVWCWYNDRLYKHKSLKDFRVWDDLSSSTDGLDDADGDVGWFDWLNFSKGKKYPEPQVVVYGHRSKEGLQIERWTKGLDTGCVKGEQLTALVLDAKGKAEVVQVDCQKY